MSQTGQSAGGLRVVSSSDKEDKTSDTVRANGAAAVLLTPHLVHREITLIVSGKPHFTPAGSERKTEQVPRRETEREPERATPAGFLAQPWRA